MTDETNEALAKFEVDLRGRDSRVRLNGVDLPKVLDVKVHQPSDGPLTVIVAFLADSVEGLKA